MRSVLPFLTSTALLSLCLFAAPAGAEEEEDELDLVSLLEGEDMVASATKIKQTIAEAPAVISVISRKDIERNNYRSVADALASVPGLYSNSDYVFRDIGVRGISGEMRGGTRLLKVMINGQPVSFRSDTTNFMGPELVPMGAVDRIEVIRGPGSALYGANAFLGVVNIVTRQASADTVAVTALGSFFNDLESTPGYDLNVMAARQIGALGVLFSVQRNRTDRSGLSLPCGTTFKGEDDACDRQRNSAQDSTIFDDGRTSVDDIAQPMSMLADIRLDIGKLVADEENAFGTLSLLANYQSLDSVGSFSDWSVLQYDQYVDGANNVVGPVDNTNNRVGLDNTMVRLAYDISFLDEALNVNVSGAYARGGTSGQDRVRDSSGATNPNGTLKERSRYGFEGYDLMGTVRWTLLEDVGEIPDMFTVLNNLTLIVQGDFTNDDVSYSENAFAQPIGFATSSLQNVGVLGQLTGSLLDRRLGFIVGGRYDSHQGAQLTEQQLMRLNQDERDSLCEGQVCYDSFNYRAGLTFSILKDFGEWEDKHLVENIYLKVLYGTAFKAPAPSFLYHDGYIGALPVKPNAGLKPQNVNSLEALLGLELLGGALKGSVVFFRNELSDKVVFDRVTGGIKAANSLTVESWGLEGNIRYRQGIVDAAIAASMQNSERLFEDEFSQGIPDTFAYPDIMANARVTVDVEWIKTFVGLTASFVGTRVGHPLNGRGDNENSRYELDPYFVLDLNLRSHPLEIFGETPTTLMVSVRNLAGTGYEYPGFQPFYNTDLPGEPRAVYFGLQQNF